MDPTKAAQELSARRGTKIIKVFNDTDVFSGVSVEATVDDADTLGAISSVSRAWPAQKIQLQPILNATFGGIAGAGDYSIHNMTGVDKLHEAGVLGKGSVVAVIDTGIDYNHPDVRFPDWLSAAEQS